MRTEMLLQKKNMVSRSNTNPPPMVKIEDITKETDFLFKVAIP